MELSAADALTAVAGQMRAALDEYHAEVERQDDGRETAVVRAFVDRMRRDAADESKAEEHAEQFRAALAKIREDRRTEWQRRQAAGQQVEAVMEMARGLRRLGIESLTLEDEMRRYLQGWLERRNGGTQPGEVNAALTSAGHAAGKGGR